MKRKKGNEEGQGQFRRATRRTQVGKNTHMSEEVRKKQDTEQGRDEERKQTKGVVGR